MRKKKIGGSSAGGGTMVWKTLEAAGKVGNGKKKKLV